MCHSMIKIKADWKNDNSYYPGINHSDDIEIELVEYIWSIHRNIDCALFSPRLLDESERLQQYIRDIKDKLGMAT